MKSVFSDPVWWAKGWIGKRINYWVCLIIYGIFGIFITYFYFGDPKWIVLMIFGVSNPIALIYTLRYFYLEAEKQTKLTPDT